MANPMGADGFLAESAVSPSLGTQVSSFEVMRRSLAVIGDVGSSVRPHDKTREILRKFLVRPK